MKLWRKFWLIWAVLAGLQAEDIRFPTGSGVIDVSLPPYSADKTGTVDATASIQQAIDAYPNGNRIIYLPNGTYKVSDTLRWSGSGGNAMKRTILQGQSRDGTVIQLVDHAPGFQDPNNERAVIWTGIRPAQRFRNAVRNLTVHTGSGNPGASGLQFYTSNQGGIFDVKVVSGDGQGKAGLDMNYTDVNENGPMLVRNLEVVGFDFGISAADFINSMTFENVVLRDQNVYGVRVWAHVLTIRGMTFEGEVPAVFTAGGCAVSILDAVFTGSGSASGVPAVDHRGSGLYLRNVTSTGFDRLVEVADGKVPDVLGNVSGEWVDGGSFRLFGETQPESLNLLVKESPNPPTVLEDPSGWVSPMSFGAAGNGVTDDSAAVQAAIDSGASVVYLDGGKTFNLTGTIYLRGNLERLIGLEGNVAGDVVFELGAAGTAPVVWIERMRNFVGNGASIRHHSSRTLVVRNVSDFAVTGDGSGDFFLDDVVGGPVVFNNPNQNIWARQFNVEQKTQTKVQNHGATLWVLGLKTENRTMAIRTDSGGRTEVIGALVYANDSTAPTDPIFEIDEAEASFVGIGEYGGWSLDFPVFVKETLSGETRELLDNDLPGRVNAANMMMLFAGHDTTGGGSATVYIAPFTGTIELPQTVDLEAVVGGGSQPMLTWSQVSGPGTAVFSQQGAAQTTVSFSVPGIYTLQVEVSESGVVQDSDTVTLEVVTGATNFPPVVSAGGDRSLTLSPFAVARTTLEGNATDPESAVLQYRWTAEGPGPVIFSDARRADSGVAFWVPGLYTLTLTADDGTQTAQDSLYVSVEEGFAFGEGPVRYRQNFSNAVGGSIPYSGTDWVVYRASTGAEASTTGGNSARIKRDSVSGETGASEGPGINSQPEPDAAVGTGGYLLHQVNGSDALVSLTTGYFWEDGVLDSPRLEWRSATAAVSVEQRAMIQVGGQWYASSQVHSISGSSGFTVRSQELSPAASNWVQVVGTPNGMEPLTLGAVAVSDLDGAVTGFGLWQSIQTGNVYVDRVELLADPPLEAVSVAGSTDGWRVGNSGEVNRALWRPLAGGGFRMEDGADGKLLMLQQQFDGMRMAFEYRSYVDGGVFDSGHLIRQPFGGDIFRNQMGLTDRGYGGVFGNFLKVVEDGSNVPRVNALDYPVWNRVELTIFPAVGGVYEVQLVHNGVLEWTAEGLGTGWTEDLRYGVGFQGETATMDLRNISVAPLGTFPPRVFAGEDQTVVSGGSVTLEGVVMDLDSTLLQTAWTKVSGPGTVNFADSEAPGTMAAFSQNGMYELRLEASDGTLQSVDYVLIQVGPSAVPAAPGPLSLVIRDAGGPLIQAADQSLNEDGFTLERRAVASGSWQTVLSAPRNEPGGVDAGLGMGRFEYRLRSWNEAGESAWVSGTLLHDVPPAVGGLAAVRQADPTEVELTWTLDPDARITEHWIYAMDTGDTDWTLLSKRGGHHTSYTDTAATAGVARSYRMVSLNPLGTGPEATVQIPGGAGGDVTPPGVPDGLGSTSVTASGFHVNWNASTDDSGVTGYEVRLDSIFQGSTATTDWSFTGLSADTLYEVEVRALDAAGNASAWSLGLQVTTLAGSGAAGDYRQNFSLGTAGTTSAVTVTDWSFFRIDTGAEITGTQGTKSVRIQDHTLSGEKGESVAAAVGSLPDPEPAVGSTGYVKQQFNNGGGYVAVATGVALSEGELRWRASTTGTSTEMRAMVQVGGVWYVSAGAKSVTGTTGFTEYSQAYDAQASAWLMLTGTPGSSPLGLGAVPGSDLSGIITGIGVYQSFNADLLYLDRVEWISSGGAYTALAEGFSLDRSKANAQEGNSNLDGVSNSMEYAFGPDATQENGARLPELQMAESGGVTLRYRARKGDPDVSYHVQYSQNLQKWHFFSGPVEVVDEDVDGDGLYEMHQAVVPLPEGWAQLFTRVEVSFKP